MSTFSQQPPNSGTLDQVLTALRKLGTHPLFATQMATVAAAAAPGATVLTLKPGPSPIATIDLAEEDPTSGALLPNTWADPTLGGGGAFSGAFAQAQIAAALKPIPPFPLLSLVAVPSAYRRGIEGELFENAQFAGFNYYVDAVAFAGGDTERFVQRQALMLLEAFRRMLRQDESLGGLVHLVRPRGPIEPGGGGRHGSGPLVMAARLRLEALVTEQP